MWVNNLVCIFNLIQVPKKSRRYHQLLEKLITSLKIISNIYNKNMLENKSKNCTLGKTKSHHTKKVKDMLVFMIYSIYLSISNF